MRAKGRTRERWMGIGQRGSGKWRRRERVEGEIERRGSVSWRLGLEGSAGPWAAATGDPNGRLGWAGISLSLTHMTEERKKIKKEKERKKKVREGTWAWGLFSRTHKNELDPGK